MDVGSLQRWIGVWAWLTIAPGFGCETSSSSGAAPTGAEECAAAGGRCVLGPVQCTTPGPGDCNPERNPGGAHCCLDELDGGVLGPPAPDGSTDDASISWPETSTDAAPNDAHVTDVDARTSCPQPLSNAEPAHLGDVPLGDWCAVHPGRIAEGTCAGYIYLAIGLGVDCTRQYFFDATTEALEAVMAGCNVLASCVEGNAGFSAPNNCELGAGSTTVRDLCAEAGIMADAEVDAARSTDAP